MTVAISWVRKLSEDCEELIFCSDSRLSGGARIDCVPKIFPLTRGDCAICFAGDTFYAYPLMIQLTHAINAYFPSRTRGMDIHDLKGHVIKVFNNMIDSVHDYTEGMENPESSFIFGGYSWVQKSFALWSIQFHEKEKRFIAHGANNFHGFGKIVFAGDRGRDAKIKLITLLRDKNEFEPDRSEKGGLNMEPFEVIRDMLKAADNGCSIGGPPQIVKVYQHMNVMPIGVYWPRAADGRISLLGRPFIGYEKSDIWILDPDTLKTKSALKP